MFIYKNLKKLGTEEVEQNKQQAIVVPLFDYMYQIIVAQNKAQIGLVFQAVSNNINTN